MAMKWLWFWNSEIGWAAAHPVLERHGFRYVNANVWNKGLAHIAGNVNTAKIRRFTVVTEICVQYIMEPHIDGLILKQWLLREWKRAGLPLRAANAACGVADAATRKYFDQGHLWYWPPVEMFRRLADHANRHGLAEGRPYFSLDGHAPMTSAAWAATRSKFRCPHGVTNVWERAALHGSERVTIPEGQGGPPEPEAARPDEPDRRGRDRRGRRRLGAVRRALLGDGRRHEAGAARLGRAADPQFADLAAERLRRGRSSPPNCAERPAD